MAAFAGWAEAVLFALAAPDTAANVQFLTDWHPYEQSKCANNPLNTTLRTATSKNCVHVSGSTYVQAYPTAAEGTKATAQTLRGSAYLAIVNALHGGNPYTYGVPQAVATAIRSWGTPRYADAYLVAVGAEPQLVPPASQAGKERQVKYAWTRLMRTIAVTAPHQLRRVSAANAQLRKGVR